jgi:hypothetical protein
VAEYLHHDALVNALGQQESGRGVPGVMNPHPADTGRCQQGIPFVPVSMSADRAPVGLAPDEIAACASWPASDSLVRDSKPCGTPSTSAGASGILALDANRAVRDKSVG